MGSQPTATVSVQSARKPRISFAILLITSCAAMLMVAEVGARAFSHVSRIERRTASELDVAKSIRGGAGRRRQVLVAGNSLLLEGVDFPALQRGLGAEVQAYRLTVEQTYYLDWYYGLRKLFLEGSRPDVVVLKLTPGQWISNQFRGDYSANRLAAARDLIPLARDAGLSPTGASSLWFAHYSRFYGTRQEIRSFLLAKLMPGMSELQPHLARVSRRRLDEEEVRKAALPRLTAMRKMAAEYGARFVMLVPATLSSDQDTAGLVTAGSQAEVQVLEPFEPLGIPGSLFSDGFHLNADGAKRYTSTLVPILRQAVLE